MTSKRQFLNTQVLEMDRLMESSAADPFMAEALRLRRESLSEELRQAPPESSNPRTVLFFAGPPVHGSRGIDAKFASDVLAPFLEMVKTQYSAQKHGRVGARGPRRGESEARLMLTGLPRGSFGLELSQPQAEDFITSEQLSDVLVRLTEVIASAGETDERFAVSMDRVSPRVLPRLKEFLDVVASTKASLGLESGELKVSLPADRVAAAFERVGAAETSEHEIEMEGVFRGATLDSWRFDFRLDDQKVIAGRIADDLDDASIEAMLPMTNKRCQARLREMTISTRDGVKRHRFELLELTHVKEQAE